MPAIPIKTGEGKNYFLKPRSNSVAIMNVSREMSAAELEHLKAEYPEGFTPHQCDRCGEPGPLLMDLTFIEIDSKVWCVCPGCQDDLIVEGLLTFTAHTLFENVEHLPEG